MDKWDIQYSTKLSVVLSTLEKDALVLKTSTAVKIRGFQDKPKVNKLPRVGEQDINTVLMLREKILKKLMRVIRNYS